MILSQIPPILLELITSWLSIAAITRIAKLSGDRTLHKALTLFGGVTQARVLDAREFLAFGSSTPPIWSEFSRLTRLHIDCDAFNRLDMPLCGAATTLPPTLEDIYVHASCAFSMFLRPVSETQDSPYLKSLVVAHKYVPMSLKQVFPALHSLCLRHHLLPWSLPSLRYFLDQLPDSLTSLSLAFTSEARDDSKVGLIPNNKNLRHLFLALQGHLHFDSFIRVPQLQETINTNALSEQTMAFPAILGLESLVMTDMQSSDAFMAQLLRFPQLQSLSLSLLHVCDYVLPLPPNLTELKLKSNFFDFEKTFIQTPLLRALKLSFHHLRHTPKKRAITYLPAALTSLDVSVEGEPMFYFDCLPPATLTHWNIRDLHFLIMPKDFHISLLRNLTSLHLPYAVVPKLGLATSFAALPALTTLTIVNNCLIRMFSVIPIQQLKALAIDLLLTSEEAPIFADLVVWSLPSFEARLKTRYPALLNVRLHLSLFPNISFHKRMLELGQPSSIILDDFPALNSVNSSTIDRLLQVDGLKIMQSLDKGMITSATTFSEHLERLEIAQCVPQSLDVSAAPLLPVSLHTLRIASLGYEGDSLWPQVSHLSALTTLWLQSSTVGAIVLLPLLPKSITDLTLGFDSPFHAWPLRIADHVPQLRKLAISNCCFPMACLLASLPSLDSLQLRSDLFVHNSILEPFDPTLQEIGEIEIFRHCITTLLPRRLRPTTSSRVHLEWNEDTVSKLPSGLASLDIKLGYQTFGVRLILPDADALDVAPSSPASLGNYMATRLPSLKSLSLELLDVKYDSFLTEFLRSPSCALTALDVFAQRYFVDTPLNIVFPDTLRSLRLCRRSNKQLSVEKLPRGLQHLWLDASNSLPDLATVAALPTSLETLHADGPPLTAAFANPNVLRAISSALPLLKRLSSENYSVLL